MFAASVSPVCAERASKPKKARLGDARALGDRQVGVAAVAVGAPVEARAVRVVAVAVGRVGRVHRVYPVAASAGLRREVVAVVQHLALVLRCDGAEAANRVRRPARRVVVVPGGVRVCIFVIFTVTLKGVKRILEAPPRRRK